jgi:hypothetical protein
MTDDTSVPRAPLDELLKEIDELQARSYDGSRPWEAISDAGDMLTKCREFLAALAARPTDAPREGQGVKNDDQP